MSCWSGDPNAGVTICRQGVCTGSGPVDCRPLTACHTAAINPQTGQCAQGFAPAGTHCGGQAMCHGGFYTPADTCDGNGFCIGGGSRTVSCAPYGCGDGACRTTCDSDSECLAGTLCCEGQCITPDTVDHCGACGNVCDTATLTCQAGACIERCAGVDCSDQTGQCTLGVCDPATGGCVAEPTNVGGECYDEDACTTGETCQADGTCGGGTLEGGACDTGMVLVDGTCERNGVCGEGSAYSQFGCSATACGDGSSARLATAEGGSVCAGGAANQGYPSCITSCDCPDGFACFPGGGCAFANICRPICGSGVMGALYVETNTESTGEFSGNQHPGRTAATMFTSADTPEPRPACRRAASEALPRYARRWSPALVSACPRQRSRSGPARCPCFRLHRKAWLTATRQYLIHHLRRTGDLDSGPPLCMGMRLILHLSDPPVGIETVPSASLP